MYECVLFVCIVYMWFASVHSPHYFLNSYVIVWSYKTYCLLEIKNLNLNLIKCLHVSAFTCTTLIFSKSDRTKYVYMQENCKWVSSEYIIYKAHLCLTLSKVWYKNYHPTLLHFLDTDICVTTCTFPFEIYI